MVLKKIFPERAVQAAFLSLLLLQIVLVVCHVGAIVWDTAATSENSRIIREFFELSREGNAPTWLSSFLFTLIGLACGAIYLAEGHAAAKSDTPSRTRPAWLLFSALFLFLSFDETSQLHERLDWILTGPAESAEAQPANELPFYNYLLIYVPVLGAFGIAMAWFVVHHFRHAATSLLFFSGMALLGMKLVIESFEKWSLSVTWFDHSIYLEMVIVEMGCLFTGATIIFTSLLRHLIRVIDGNNLLRTPLPDATVDGNVIEVPRTDARAIT